MNEASEATSLITFGGSPVEGNDPNCMGKICNVKGVSDSI